MEETIVNKEMDDFLIFRLFDTFDDDILNSGPLPIWVKRHKKGILQFDEEITPIHVHSASEIISNCISNDIAKGTYNICSNHIVSSDEVLNKLLLKHDNYIEKKSRKGQNSFPDYVDSRCWEKFFKF